MRGFAWSLTVPVFVIEGKGSPDPHADIIGVCEGISSQRTAHWEFVYLGYHQAVEDQVRLPSLALASSDFIKIVVRICGPLELPLKRKVLPNADWHPLGSKRILVTV